MQKNSRIFIVGHNDSIENSLLEGLAARGFTQAVSNGTEKIDCLNQAKTQQFFKNFHPDYVLVGSIRSGGIGANLKYPAEFLYENVLAQSNVIHAAYTNKVKKLLFFTGSCAYPKDARQPIKEESLLTAELEKSSEPYSVAKITGTKMCEAYRKQYGFNAIVAVPATLYGPGSDSDLETAHVMGALIAKFHKAKMEGSKEVAVWGSGKPRREFLYVDDFVNACLLLMEKYEGDLINVGPGEDVTIKELAGLIAKVSGFKGKITFDTTKPDGTIRKLMDNSRVRKLGFKPKINLEEGIQKTYHWYINQKG